MRSLACAAIERSARHGIIPALPPKPPGPEAPIYSVDNKDPGEIQDDDLIDEQEYAKFRYCAIYTDLVLNS